MADENMKIDRIPRGSNPPYLRLAEAFELTKNIYEQAGSVASYNHMSQLTGNSTSSSSFVRKLASLRWYGLATDQEKTVTLTEIGNAIAAPQTPEAASEAKKRAFLNVEVFARVYDRHKGKLLPADEFLGNIIEQDCKIPRDLSPVWVIAFKEGAKAADLFLERADGKTQILDSPILTTHVQSRPHIPVSWESGPPKEPVSPSLPPPQEGSVTVPISASGHYSKIEVSGGRYAEFRIPDRITARDAQKIKKALVGYESLLESMVSDDDDGGPSKNGTQGQ